MDLSAYRAQHNLTLAEIAGRVGVSVVTIHRWEARKARPSWRNLERLVAATDGQVTSSAFLPASDPSQQRTAA